MSKPAGAGAIIDTEEVDGGHELVGDCLRAGRVALGELLDGVARMHALIAQATAWRAVLIEQTRLWSEMNVSALVNLDGRTPVATRQQFARRALVAELAAAMRISERSAERLLEESTTLSHDLPETLQALQGGEISHRHASTIVDQAWGLTAATRDDAQQTAAQQTEAAPDASEIGNDPESETGNDPASEDSDSPNADDCTGRRAVLSAFERHLLPDARTTTPTIFERRARKARERLHPETITRRRIRAAANRDVRLEPARDGMAWLGLNLEAPIAVAAYHRITGTATSLQGPDEPRTLPQLRADVATDLLLRDQPTPVTTDQRTPPETGGSTEARHSAHSDQSPDCTSPSSGGALSPGSALSPGTATSFGSTAALDPSARSQGADRRFDDADYGFTILEDGPVERDTGRFQNIRPTIVVTVPVLTLMGLSDEPADLEGHGPIDPETARALAANAPSFQRILTDPETGTILSVGRTSYRVPADLKRALRVRDTTCRFPGCNRAARFSDLDHTRDWQHGGETSATNLAHLCPKHHALKHNTRWNVTQARDGTLTWTAPSGHTYTTTPELTIGPAVHNATTIKRAEPPTQNDASTASASTAPANTASASTASAATRQGSSAPRTASRASQRTLEPVTENPPF